MVILSSTRLDRSARRRQQTRAALIAAARRVMSEKGADGATITGIAEAADVGFGSFYNYFDSKEDILTAVIAEIVEEHGRSLDALASAIEDPAEVLAISVRHTVRMVDADPTWGAFVVRFGLERERLVTGLSRRMVRDLERGYGERRFDVPDQVGAAVAIGGLVLSTMRARLAGALDPGCDEPAAEMALRLLGVPRREAARIARRPLPELTPPVSRS